MGKSSINCKWGISSDQMGYEETCEASPSHHQFYSCWSIRKAVVDDSQGCPAYPKGFSSGSGGMTFQFRMVGTPA